MHRRPLDAGGTSSRQAFGGWPGLDSARGSSLTSDLAAGHLQGPARTVTTDTDHLLSLVVRTVAAARTDPQPWASSGDAPSPAGPSGRVSPLSADNSSGPSASLPSSATAAAVGPSDSTTSATAETRSSSR